MNAAGWIAFLLAAGVGACARFLLATLVQQRVGGERPWGTFTVNVAGSLAAGLVAGSVIHHGLGSQASTVLAVGLLGSFTTFSTFTYESVRLIETGAWKVASANVVGTMLGGIAAAAVGLAIAAAV